MPPKHLEKLARRRMFGPDDVVVMRPGIGIVMYSYADLHSVMAAAADVLESYLAYVPPGAIGATYSPPGDEYSPDEFVPFSLAERNALLRQLRFPQQGMGGDDEGYGFALTATLNGSAGDYGARLGGIDFSSAVDADEETSMLRLELPWNWLDSHDVEGLVDFVAKVADQFPFCTGNAGLSFIYTVGYTTAAREELQKLLPRFLGFDPAYDTAQLRMRGKSPTAHWLNLLDDDLVAKLGGAAQLSSALAGCELRHLKRGVLVRSAEFPSVVDVNRQAPDIGLLPVVASALTPVRFDAARFVGITDEQEAEAWLERFDGRAPGVWANG